MKQIKPVPYYTQCDTFEFKALADELRALFLPMIERRFDMHHLCGFSHQAIIQYIARWKKDYPYYLRADITKYYPTVHPAKLVAQTQLAYRDLLSLPYVPKKFKDRFFLRMGEWMRSLPMDRGIPLGSAMSAILAPVALIPVWLALKRRHRENVKLIIYMDDVLVLCREPGLSRSVWQMLSQKLYANLGVELNPDKTKEGRFAGSKIEFCGWSFAGGYARIAENKCRDFKQRVMETIKNTKKNDTRSFIKRVNNKIDGFGNYYKYGHVLRQFHELDAFIRVQVRGWLARGISAKAHANAELEKLGLHSLLNCYKKIHAGKTPPKKQPSPPVEYYERKPPKIDFGVINAIAQHGETITRQLAQLIAQQRKILNILTDFNLHL
ncbi:MAG: hypothetical protein LBU42_01460 [Prevotellaceae bacterium]|jgi:hypothetical protein|nr:hypothetical protein [Prevotellaceae bacterium]